MLRIGRKRNQKSIVQFLHQPIVTTTAQCLTIAVIAGASLVEQPLFGRQLRSSRQPCLVEFAQSIAGGLQQNEESLPVAPAVEISGIVRRFVLPGQPLRHAFTTNEACK